MSRPRAVLAASLGAIAGLSCAPPPRRGAAAPATSIAPAVAAVPAVSSADPFVASVRPVLLRRCVPCHEPGGQMYGRMPFDAPETIRSHREGVLRRIKVPEERAALEAWLAAN
jgi:hypothetical protein